MRNGMWRLREKLIALVLGSLGVQLVDVVLQSCRIDVMFPVAGCIDQGSRKNLLFLTFIISERVVRRV